MTEQQGRMREKRHLMIAAILQEAGLSCDWCKLFGDAWELYYWGNAPEEEAARLERAGLKVHGSARIGLKVWNGKKYVVEQTTMILVTRTES